MNTYLNTCISLFHSVAVLITNLLSPPHFSLGASKTAPEKGKRKIKKGTRLSSALETAKEVLQKDESDPLQDQFLQQMRRDEETMLESK